MSSGSDTSHSFADLMTSLAVIFILFFVATINNASSESDRSKEKIKKVAEELEKIGLSISEDPDDPYTEIINLDEKKVKFDPNGSKLSKDGTKIVDNLFLILTPKLCDKDLKNDIESVLVEGHTDSTGNRFTEGKLKNIKISQDRAFAVFKEAFTALGKNQTEIDCLRFLSAAVGRGSSRLLDSDSKSRRVEVKIRVKHNSLEKLMKSGAKT